MVRAMPVCHVPDQHQRQQQRGVGQTAAKPVADIGKTIFMVSARLRKPLAIAISLVLLFAAASILLFQYNGQSRHGFTKKSLDGVKNKIDIKVNKGQEKNAKPIPWYI
jgi:hypothetical protein